MEQSLRLAEQVSSSLREKFGYTAKANVAEMFPIIAKEDEQPVL